MLKFKHSFTQKEKQHKFEYLFKFREVKIISLFFTLKKKYKETNNTYFNSCVIMIACCSEWAEKKIY